MVKATSHWSFPDKESAFELVKENFVNAACVWGVFYMIGRKYVRFSNAYIECKLSNCLLFCVEALTRMWREVIVECWARKLMSWLRNRQYAAFDDEACAMLISGLLQHVTHFKPWVFTCSCGGSNWDSLYVTKFSPESSFACNIRVVVAPASTQQEFIHVNGNALQQDGVR